MKKTQTQIQTKNKKYCLKKTNAHTRFIFTLDLLLFIIVIICLIYDFWFYISNLLDYFYKFLNLGLNMAINDTENNNNIIKNIHNNEAQARFNGIKTLFIYGTGSYQLSLFFILNCCCAEKGKNNNS